MRWLSEVLFSKFIATILTEQLRSTELSTHHPQRSEVAKEKEQGFLLVLLKCSHHQFAPRPPARPRRGLPFRGPRPGHGGRTRRPGRHGHVFGQNRGNRSRQNHHPNPRPSLHPSPDLRRPANRPSNPPSAPHPSRRNSIAHGSSARLSLPSPLSDSRTPLPHRAASSARNRPRPLRLMSSGVGDNGESRDPFPDLNHNLNHNLILILILIPKSINLERQPLTKGHL